MTPAAPLDDDISEHTFSVDPLGGDDGLSARCSLEPLDRFEITHALR